VACGWIRYVHKVYGVSDSVPANFQDSAHSRWGIRFRHHA
jgi:hypothetical protein